MADKTNRLLAITAAHNIRLVHSFCMFDIRSMFMLIAGYPG